MFHLNQLLKMTAGLLLLTILGILGTMAYGVDFDFPSTLAYIQGFFISGYLPFLNFEGLDLNYGLRAFATLLFFVVSVIFTFKTLSKGRAGIAIVAFLAQIVVASLLLTSTSSFYPSYPLRTPESSFLQPLLDFINGEALDTATLSIYASLTSFLVIFVFLHITLLISFARTPYSNLKSVPLSLGKEKVIADELSRFVVPTFQSAAPTKLVSTPAPMIQPQPVIVLPVKATPEPVSVPEVVKPIIRPLQDPKLEQAKVEVSQLKEKIRIIIRNELSKQPIFESKVEEVDKKLTTQESIKPVIDSKVETFSLPSNSMDIQGKIKDVIDAHFSTLEPKNREMVAYLINEELIKYDALNREVLESFIQEKIQSSTADAIEALRQEFTSLYEEKVKSLAVPLQPVLSLNQVTSEETVLTPVIQDHQVEAIVEKYLVTHPLLQAINVPQQEAQKPVDLSVMKEDILSILRTELATLQTSSSATKDGELTKSEVISGLKPSIDLETIKEELLNQLRKELADKPISTNQSVDVDAIKTQVIDSLPVSLELESIKEDFLTLIRAELLGIKHAVNVPVENEATTDQLPSPLAASELNGLKDELLTQLRSELVVLQPQGSQSFTTNLPSTDLESLRKDLVKVIEEKVQQVRVTPIVVAPREQSSSSLTRHEIEGMISEYLLAHPVYHHAQEEVLPPKLKIKEAKAPSNNLRSEQFRTVVIPAEGVTRTGKKKIVRIPFYTRMAYAHPSLTAQYDELKNYLLAYKVKSRLSNTGDTFRLHKDDYAKITIAGKSLKLYLALDPKNYQDSTIPIDDVSDKKMYRDLPSMIKIKSGLSVKRAKQLIDDLMKQKDLQQKAVGEIQWSLQFKNI